jgi:excisionase family DNA binding protein
MSEPEQLLTVAEVAGTLQVSRATVFRYLRLGLLPSIRLGRSRRIARAALDAFLADAARTGSVPAAWPSSREKAARHAERAS